MRSIPDHLVIEALAQSEIELRERIASLEQDVACYRLIAVEAIHALHAVTRERDAARRQCRERRPADQQRAA